MRSERTRTSLLVALFTALFVTVCTGCVHVGQPQRADRSAEGEEVTIGYGTQQKDNVTGSVVTVDAEDATKKRHVATVADLLKGRVAGVIVREAPGGGLLIRIRGRGSIRGSGEPLYVIDGMPIHAEPGGALRGINPYDIKSITVLKDAAAAAIYGSRGAHGVVLITTKIGTSD